MTASTTSTGDVEGEDAGVPSGTDWPGVALFCVMIAFYWSAMYVYVPIMPVYARSLGASLAMVGLLVSAYGFSQMLLRIPIGVLSDRLGARRPFIALGFIAAAAGAMGLALAPTPEWLVVARAVVGISASMWVTATVLFAGYFAPGEAARAISLVSFVGGISQLVATSAGGKLAEDWGWQAPFYAGAALAVGGLVATLFVRENRVRHEPPTLRRLVAIGTIPTLLLVSSVAALAQFAFWGTTYTFVPLYADALGANKTELGLVTSAATVLYTVTTLVAATAATRLGARATILGGLVLTAATTVAVPFVTSLGALALTQVLGGVGRGLSSTILMSESIRAVSPAERATAMGVFQAVYAIGMFAGPATSGVVAETLGIAGAFWASALLLGVGAAIGAVAIGGRVTAR